MASSSSYGRDSPYLLGSLHICSSFSSLVKPLIPTRGLRLEEEIGRRLDVIMRSSLTSNIASQLYLALAQLSPFLVKLGRPILYAGLYMQCSKLDGSRKGRSLGELLVNGGFNSKLTRLLSSDKQRDHSHQSLPGCRLEQRPFSDVDSGDAFLDHEGVSDQDDGEEDPFCPKQENVSSLRLACSVWSVPWFLECQPQRGMPSTRALLTTNHSLAGRSGSAFQVRYPNRLLSSTGAWPLLLSYLLPCSSAPYCSSRSL
ncbi:hypothetical protein Salat_2289900 [Sesamum alatum]|uniref:Uncharacterized protein n=1 Tax=Sesamum alatum TaxID=300844 RepID=A0AAE1XW98_9LAMI|nr:hypothetical protein Salat_2289900 [Sesamum alatum]